MVITATFRSRRRTYCIGRGVEMMTTRVYLTPIRQAGIVAIDPSTPLFRYIMSALPQRTADTSQLLWSKPRNILRPIIMLSSCQRLSLLWASLLSLPYCESVGYYKANGQIRLLGSSFGILGINSTFDYVVRRRYFLPHQLCKT